MESRKISVFSKDYPVCKALQKRAFPKEEQYPLWALHLMAARKGVDYLAFYDEGLFCGIAYTSVTDRMIYVLYLAVNDALRSQGYGTQILSLLKEQNPEKEITLNIEPLDERSENYEQRKRRMAFYRRNGFCDTGYCLADMTGEYSILSTADNFSAADYKKAIAQIGMNFYKPKVIACTKKKGNKL